MFDKIVFNNYEDYSISIDVRNTFDYIIRKGRIDLQNVNTEELQMEWVNVVANELGGIAFKLIKQKCKALEIGEWTFSGRMAGWFTLINAWDIETVQEAEDYEELDGDYFQLFGNTLSSNSQLRRLQNLIDSDLNTISKIIKSVVDTKGVEIIKALSKDLILSENINLNNLRKIVREELNKLTNKRRLTEGETSEDRAKFGVFTYWIEGDEPEAIYFTNKLEAIQYAKELVNGFAMNYEDDYSLPESIEVWAKDRDGMWSNSGRPEYEYYFEGQPTLQEALSLDQKRAAKEYGLDDDEFRVNMILAKAGYESLSTDFVYQKSGRGGFNKNRNTLTGDMDKLIDIASVEARRIREVRKAVARGDAAVSLANQYDFMEEPALVVATVFYDHANNLVGSKMYGIG